MFKRSFKVVASKVSELKRFDLSNTIRVPCQECKAELVLDNSSVEFLKGDPYIVVCTECAGLSEKERLAGVKLALEVEKILKPLDHEGACFWQDHEQKVVCNRCRERIPLIQSRLGGWGEVQ